jgi:UDP-glucuronate 4-epimerase
MTVLVTGAAGFIGSHLSERLVADGVEVRGVDRLSDFYDPARKRRNIASLMAGSGFEFVEGDLNSVDLKALMAGVDVVYHLAGQAGVRSSWGTEFTTYLDDNVLATQRLLEVARELSLDRFVVASSSSIYGDAEHFPTKESEKPAPVSPYGMTKLAAEHLGRLYFRAFDVPVVALRYFTVFGPRQRPDMAFCRFIGAALEGNPITVFGDGLQERDFTYVGDIVEATTAAAARGEPGAVYNVAGGNHATVADVIEVLGGLTGEPLEVERSATAIGDARKTGADIGLARRDLGYEPSTSLEEGIGRQLEDERRMRETGPEER